MRRLLFALLALLFLLAPAYAQNWKLIWSDEFDGPANTPPDSSKWAYATGATGWGNDEWENYTNQIENAFLDGKGNLVIHAIQTNPDGGRGAYTSARLLTRGKFTFTYGKVEARIKIPFGQGIWPAFWMLGAEGRWPAGGEIDILENIGKEPSTVHGTIHGPGYSGGNGIGAPYSLPGGKRFSDDFHTYAVIWTAEAIEFFVDDHSYNKILASTVTAKGNEWVYTKPFYLLLNLAVGGNWPGYPDSTTRFPQDMTIDYVRVHQSLNPLSISRLVSRRRPRYNRRPLRNPGIRSDLEWLCPKSVLATLSMTTARAAGASPATPLRLCWGPT